MKKEYLLHYSCSDTVTKMYAEKDSEIITKVSEIMIALINSKTLREWLNRPIMKLRVIESDRLVCDLSF